MFTDCIKAFDNMRRMKLWSTKDRRTIPNHVINVVRNMYKDTEIMAITEYGGTLF